MGRAGRWHSQVLKFHWTQGWHDPPLEALRGRRTVETDKFDLRVVPEERKEVIWFDAARQNITIETAGAVAGIDHVP